MPPFPLDSLSRRLLRQAVLRVHPDVFAGVNLEAASFNAESLVVRKRIDRRKNSGRLFCCFLDLLDSCLLASSAFCFFSCARPSDRCQENILFDRSRGKKM